MPAPVDGHAHVNLSLEESQILDEFISRARVVMPPKGRERRAIAHLRELMQEITAPQLSLEPAPEDDPIAANTYGNHHVIPEDWRPSQGTLAWLRQILEGQDIDLGWLTAEFISYWQARGRAMASWQQCFRNNVLQKLARGTNLAPSHPRRPVTRTVRIFDRSAELRDQRLGDFDAEAADIVNGAAGPGPGAGGAMGPDDRRPAGKNSGG